MTTSSKAAEGAPWSELLSAALLGTERRTPPGGSVTALLDAAAVETVRHRAGLLPARAGARPEAAPHDARPPLPTAAAQRLTVLLSARHSGAGGNSSRRRGRRPDLAELLPQWLATANEFGYRAPAAQLPALLQAARARTDLRSETLRFAGPRGLWLARFNPEWKFALRDGVPRVAAGAVGEGDRAADRASGAESESEPGSEVDGAARQLWEEGLFAERVALLTALRRRAPSAGLALLAGTWSSERAEDRLMFLDSLREGLCSTDESFLEQALGDRSRTVRATAAELLSNLPSSALATRMAARARTYVTADPFAAAPGIAVEAPHECDPSMQRDGVVPKPPSGQGERAWWLVQLVEAAPLSVWPEQFGGRSPREIVELPVADGWKPDLHAAWRGAAVRQRDTEWARALIGAPTDRIPAEYTPLLALLPEDERAERAACFVGTHGLSEAFQVLEMCPGPWGGPLGRAVIDALQIARDAGSYPWKFSGVMGLAERCLAPSDAVRLEPLAAVRDEPKEASPGAGTYWAEAFHRMVATLRLRAVMREELRGG